MLSFLSYFGASSSFEKHRLLLTTKNYEAPDQTSLKKIIETFRGQDEQTRAQIAFATILKKIHTSDSNDNWVYLLKNLIIFDRVVQENCFLEQIASLNLKPIENYQQKHDNAKALNSQNILKSYWKLIQYKSCLLSQKSYPKGMQYMHMLNPNDIKSKRDNSFSKNSNSATQTKITPPKKVSIMIGKQQNNECYDSERSILSVLRSQKHQFLKTLSIQQIYKQALQLETLFVYIFKFTLTKPINKKSNILSKQNQQMDSSGLSVNRARDNSKKQQVSSPLLENLLGKNSNSQVRQQSSKSRQKFKSVREQFYNSKLANYIHLQLLYKLICTYTNQLFCIKMFVSHLLQQTIGTNLGSAQTLKSSKVLSNQTMSQVEINQWKKIIANYLNYSQKIINYVQKHKTTKGFQLINYSQLSPFQNANIFSILDDFIEHKNTFLQPEIVKVEELGSIMGGINNQIKVQRKAQWSYQKALTARKMVFPSRNLKDKNTPFSNWHNSYSSSFPPKQILTLDLIMQMRQNPHNPATETSFQDDQDQSIYQPFIVNRHSCIYNYRQSNISMVSQCQFIPVEEMKKKDEEKLQSAVSQKTKSFYYFRYPEREKRFQNIYSKVSKENGTIWIK